MNNRFKKHTISCSKVLYLQPFIYIVITRQVCKMTVATFSKKPGLWRPRTHKRSSSKDPGRCNVENSGPLSFKRKKSVRAITEISTDMFHPLSNVLRVGKHIGGRGSSAIPKSSRELIIWGLNMCHLSYKANPRNLQTDLFGQCFVCWFFYTPPFLGGRLLRFSAMPHHISSFSWKPLYSDLDAKAPFSWDQVLFKYT